MQISLIIVIFLVLLILIFSIIYAVNSKILWIGYLIFWSIIGILLIVALCIPGLVENFSKMIGFEMPINMIFSVAIFIILYLIFNLTTLISQEQKKNVLLIQEVSMLKARIDELERTKKLEK